MERGLFTVTDIGSFSEYSGFKIVAVSSAALGYPVFGVQFSALSQSPIVPPFQV